MYYLALEITKDKSKLFSIALNTNYNVVLPTAFIEHLLISEADTPKEKAKPVIPTKGTVCFPLMWLLDGL